MPPSNIKVVAAVIGWVLIAPPVESGHVRFYRDAPLSHWRVYGTYESEGECAQAKLQAYNVLRQSESPLSSQFIALSRCFQADDPRLKK